MKPLRKGEVKKCIKIKLLDIVGHFNQNVVQKYFSITVFKVFPDIVILT